jgi:regulator of sirC expression with transglutaminase-like and TPR domain
MDALVALDVFAGDCPTPTADGVARYLFDTLGFSGNRSAYYDWRNSCLDRVIATRVGIPISLSILMIEVGRRVGVPLVGVGMPAHFLVRPRDDTGTFYDPFHGADRLDRSDARRLFEQVTSGQAPWDESYLDPTSNRDIVIRMLNNLKGSFARQSDAVRFGMVMQLRAAVPELAESEAPEIVASTAIFN